MRLVGGKASRPNSRPPSGAGGGGGGGVAREHREHKALEAIPQARAVGPRRQLFTQEMMQGPPQQQNPREGPA